MKRLIAALALTVFIGLVHFTGDMYIKNVIKESRELVEECITDYKKEENPQKSADALKDYWREKENFMSIFAHHESIDEIEAAIDSLVVYASTKDSEIFYEYSGTVKTLLHQLREDNSITMHSIF